VLRQRPRRVFALPSRSAPSILDRRHGRSAVALLTLSSTSHDDDAADGSEESAATDSPNDTENNLPPQQPLFPDLSPPPPPPPPPEESSSYDDAADALLGGKGRSGERALSSSDQVRDALESGGVMEALEAIARARQRGGDWYQEGNDDDVGNDTGGRDDDEAASDMANLEYLLGRIKEGRSNDERSDGGIDTGDVDSLWSD